MIKSPNFAFLEVHDPQLVRLASLAERYFQDDPITCIMKLRQFGELLAQLVSAKVGLYRDEDEAQLKLLNRLSCNNLIPGEVEALFHEIRKVGNDATHQHRGNHSIALHTLKYARQLAIWYHRTFSQDRNFKPSAFMPPANPKEEQESLIKELEELRRLAEISRTETELAQAKALEESELRKITEEVLKEVEKEAESVKKRLADLQLQTGKESQKLIQNVIAWSQEAERNIDLSEPETRQLIDSQLREAGWEVDSETLHYQKGTRPQKGHNLAIAEYPTRDGIADYALFVGLQIVAVVEAKRRSKDVYSAIDQAKRYSKGYQVRGQESFPQGSPWGEYHIPFVFASNGREFLRQLETKSGIWFCDLRNPKNLRRPLSGWYSPQGLMDLLSQDVVKSHEQLDHEGFNYNVTLRDYQIKAIQAIEKGLSDNKNRLLLAMATGTGKTKTALVLLYRLLKTKRFRRVLFLVDRKLLGIQASDTFKETKIENLQTFSNIFGVRDIDSKTEDNLGIKVHIATVQSFVSLLFNNNNGEKKPPINEYDCIVVDECHRGYLLDQELTQQELEYRDFNDYISKYRRVLDYFDAVKIGLTATPARHSIDIFGDPIFSYGYREAVIDGWLIDHEPPFIIKTELSQEGIKWEKGEEMQLFDPQKGTIDLIHTPDEMTFEVDQFNRQVVTESFNQVVCQELVNQINFSEDCREKTLIFCVNDNHADDVVRLLKNAVQDYYGSVDDDAIIKVTGKADQPQDKIRRFKNENAVKVAVTVDLLTTGVDVPAICNLVFLRRVNSRILYEQMLGRATRRCDEINKQVFRIFDAVYIYETLSQVSDMKPVVKSVNITFSQLIHELQTVTNPESFLNSVEQFLGKLQRLNHRLSDRQQEEITEVLGMNLEALVKHCKETPPPVLAQWFQQREGIAELFDRKYTDNHVKIISNHQDQLIGTERGYGKGTKPEDYLKSFQQFIEDNMNTIPSLVMVTQHPNNLTRKDFKELVRLLDREGYTQESLKTAWQEMTNEEITTNIMSFIRQVSLGDALIPYSERVDKALKKILASRSWKPHQRDYLKRIASQIKLEIVLTKENLDEDSFKQAGGFVRLNKIFEDKLESILDELKSEIWKVS